LNPAFDLAVSIGAGWEVAEAVSSPTEMRLVDRVASDDLGNVLAFRADLGVLEAFGTWPAVAASGNRLDPILPVHRGGTLFGRSMAYDENSFIFAYALSVVGGGVEGGVYDGASATTTLANKPISARRIGERIIVAATGIGGLGTAIANSPMQAFAFDRADPTAPIALLTASESYSEDIHFGFLGDDVLVTRLSGPNPTFDASVTASVHRFSKASFTAATAATVLPAPAESEFDIDVVDSFDVDGGVALVVGFGLPEAIVVVSDVGGNVEGSAAVSFDPDCTNVPFSFAVFGDPVVAVGDAFGDGSFQLIRLRRR